MHWTKNSYITINLAGYVTDILCCISAKLSVSPYFQKTLKCTDTEEKIERFLLLFQLYDHRGRIIVNVTISDIEAHITKGRQHIKNNDFGMALNK